MSNDSSKALINWFNSFLAIPDKPWVFLESIRTIWSLARVALEWPSRILTWFACYLWFLPAFTAVFLQDHSCVLQVTIGYADHHYASACVVAEAHAFGELPSYHTEEDSSWAFLFGNMTHQFDLASELLKLSFKLRLVLAFSIDLLACLSDLLSDFFHVPLA